MPFYRYADPTYNLLGGAFPGVIGSVTYDRLNVTSEGTGGGDGSAIVGPQKVGAPNAGTFFVAFGEQGLSSHVNRGLAALGYNTDALDDLFRTSTPKIATQLVAGANQTAVVLTGDVFVGDSGAIASDVAALYVVDTTLSRPYVSGTAVSIIDVDDGTPSSSVLGMGFYTNPTARMNIALPAGANYLFVFFLRTSTARTLEQDRQELSKSHAQLTQGIANINRVLAYGLDEIYRRSLIKPDTFTNDAPGDGAAITRDGKAITLTPSPQDWTANAFHDPFLAHVVGGLSAPNNLTSMQRPYSGDLNHVHIGMWRVSETNVGEETTRNRPLSSYVALNVRNPTGTTFGGVATYTYIPKDAAATLNAASIGVSTVTVGGSFYFRNGSGDTGIMVGYDVLLITRQSGDVETYVISSIQAGTRVEVRTLGGSLANFPADEAVTISWAQPLFAAGGGMSDYVGNDPKWGPLTVLWPTLLSANSAAYDAPLPPVRFAGPALSLSQPLFALGLADPASGNIQDSLLFYGDGTIAGRINARDLTTRTERADRFVFVASGTQTFNWNPASHGSYVVIRFAADDSDLTIAVSGSYTPEDGDKVIFEFEPSVNNTGCTVTWSGDFAPVLEGELSIIDYQTDVWQVVRGQYNSNQGQFVSRMDATPGTTLREKLIALGENRQYAFPPYDVSTSVDNANIIYVGQAGNSFYVAHRGGDWLYYSEDGQAPWVQCSTGAIVTPLNPKRGSAVAADGNELVMVFVGPSSTAWVYYSADAGISWQDGPALSASEVGLKEIVHVSGGTYWALSSGASPTNIAYFGTTGGGAWTAATAPTAGPNEEYAWGIDSSSTRVVIVGEDSTGTDGKIMSNRTGTSPLTLEYTAVGVPLRCVARNSFTSRWIAMGASSSAFWTSDDNGQTWTQRTMTGLPGGCEVRRVVPLGYIHVCAYVLSTDTASPGEYRYRLAISGDDGRTWLDLNSNASIATASSSYDSGQEEVRMIPDGKGARVLLNFGQLQTNVNYPQGAVASWRSGRIGTV